MDVDAEMRMVNRDLHLTLERKHLIAMARLEGMTPEAYAAKMDAAKPSAMEEIGAIYRGISDSMNELVKQFTRGWNGSGY